MNHNDLPQFDHTVVPSFPAAPTSCRSDATNDGVNFNTNNLNLIFAKSAQATISTVKSCFALQRTAAVLKHSETGTLVSDLNKLINGVNDINDQLDVHDGSVRNTVSAYTQAYPTDACKQYAHGDVDPAYLAELKNNYKDLLDQYEDLVLASDIENACAASGSASAATDDALVDAIAAATTAVGEAAHLLQADHII